MFSDMLIFIFRQNNTNVLTSEELRNQYLVKYNPDSQS